VRAAASLLLLLLLLRLLRLLGAPAGTGFVVH